MHLSFKFSKKSREKAVPIPYHSSIQILPSSVSISKSFKSDFNLSLDQGVAFFSVLWTISKEESECLIRALITEKKNIYLHIHVSSDNIIRWPRELKVPHATFHQV